MITYKEYKTFTPHDPFVAGNNLSYLGLSLPLLIFSERQLRI